MSRPMSLSHTFRLPVEPTAAFRLFSNPRYLDALTPHWFRVELRSDPLHHFAAGVEISYRLRWRGLPLSWTSLLTDWDPPRFFAYEQKAGPYKFFRHEHSFVKVENGTEVCDRAIFNSPGGHLVSRLFVLPDLRRIFRFRERAALEVVRRAQADAPDSRTPSLIPRTSASSSAIE